MYIVGILVYTDSRQSFMMLCVSCLSPANGFILGMACSSRLAVDLTSPWLGVVVVVAAAAGVGGGVVVVVAECIAELLLDCC